MYTSRHQKTRPYRFRESEKIISGLSFVPQRTSFHPCPTIGRDRLVLDSSPEDGIRFPIVKMVSTPASAQPRMVRRRGTVLLNPTMALVLFFLVSLVSGIESGRLMRRDIRRGQEQGDESAQQAHQQDADIMSSPLLEVPAGGRSGSSRKWEGSSRECSPTCRSFVLFIRHSVGTGNFIHDHVLADISNVLTEIRHVVMRKNSWPAVLVLQFPPSSRIGVLTSTSRPPSSCTPLAPGVGVHLSDPEWSGNAAYVGLGDREHRT